MQRKPFFTFLVILLLLTLAGLGYAGWQAGRQPDLKSRRPSTLPATRAATVTPTPGWWSNLPPQPIIPTRPGRLMLTSPLTVTFPSETSTSDKHISATPTQIGTATP